MKNNGISSVSPVAPEPPVAARPDCTLYDIGREGEVDYLVMEFLEGDTARESFSWLAKYYICSF